MPDVSQYMMDVNHWFNPKSSKAQALKKRVEATGALFTFEVYLTYTNVMLLADLLERAGSADKAKLTDALASSTFKAELMPYGPTKFVNGQNQGGKPGGHAVAQGRHRGDRTRGVRLGQGGVPQAEALRACSTLRSSSPASSMAFAGGIYVLVAGLTLIYGVLHIINFACCSLSMLAMYAVFWLWRLVGVDPYVALPLVTPAPSSSASCSTGW